MIDYLGGDSIAGGKLREVGTKHWVYPNVGATNESGFTALPAGVMQSYLTWGLSEAGIWWTSTGDIGLARAWYTNYDGLVNWWKLPLEQGASLRCIKDSYQMCNLNILDENFTAVTDLNFYSDNNSFEIVIFNFSAGKTINISSIYTKNSTFYLDRYSANLLPGDSIHLIITFNPTYKNIYLDTLYIVSNDPYDSLITIPLFGTFLPEISFTDTTIISCFEYSNGSATVTPTLGTPPYQFKWDDPLNSIDSIVTDLSANNWYHVMVTDAKGYTVKDSIRLTQPEKLLISQSDFSEFICLGSSKGFININPTGGTSPYLYSWSTGQNFQNIAGIPTGNYSVTINDQNNCQITDSFTIQEIIPYENEEICLVSVDLQSGMNLIIWERTSEQAIISYNIYRETNVLNVYELIGTSDFGNPGLFIDENSYPKKQSYRYKLSITDTCSNESNMSTYHATMLLQLNIGLNGGTNLQWSKYEGFEVQTFNIWRGQDLNNMFLIGSVSGNNFTFTDEYPLAGTNIYQVEVVAPYSCNPDNLKATYNSSFSNPAFRYPEGIDNSDYRNNLWISPNPFNESTFLNFVNPEGYAYTLYIMDLSGKICHIVDNINTSEYLLERGDLNQGFYFIELRGPNIYRGKIIVE
jgi:hypothetical protein